MFSHERINEGTPEQYYYCLNCPDKCEDHFSLSNQLTIAISTVRDRKWEEPLFLHFPGGGTREAVFAGYVTFLTISPTPLLITNSCILVAILICFFFDDLFLQAIQKGNLEGAKIHAENSIRQKNQVSLWTDNEMIHIGIENCLFAHLNFVKRKCMYPRSPCAIAFLSLMQKVLHWQ